MRIYLPSTAEDRSAVESAASGLELSAGRAAWGVTAEARADHPGEDEEDLEYEALQDAVHIAYGSGPSTSRALIIAADAPEGALGAETETGGAFGIVVREGVRAKIASFQVTELDAAAAEADDTDPALLWFDASEGAEALAFLEGTLDA
jgi:hypothetical protein